MNVPSSVSAKRGPCDAGDAGAAGKENSAAAFAFRPQRRPVADEVTDHAREHAVRAAHALSTAERTLNSRSSPTGPLEHVNATHTGACLAGLRSNLRGARREDGWQNCRYSSPWRRRSHAPSSATPARPSGLPGTGGPEDPVAAPRRPRAASDQEPVITVPVAPRPAPRPRPDPARLDSAPLPNAAPTAALPSGHKEYLLVKNSATSGCPSSDTENTSADALLAKEAGEVRKILKDYEDSFLLNNGRPVRGMEDLGDMAPVYRRYRRLKAALAALKENED